MCARTGALLEHTKRCRHLGVWILRVPCLLQQYVMHIPGGRLKGGNQKLKYLHLLETLLWLCRARREEKPSPAILALASLQSINLAFLCAPFPLLWLHWLPLPLRASLSFWECVPGSQQCLLPGNTLVQNCASLLYCLSGLYRELAALRKDSKTPLPGFHSWLNHMLALSSSNM